MKRIGDRRQGQGLASSSDKARQLETFHVRWGGLSARVLWGLGPMRLISDESCDTCGEG